MFVIILFQFEGDVRPLSVRRETTLRDVQEQLCKMFGRPFPKTKCVLDVAGVLYEDFIERPFEDIVVDFTPCNIYFQPTDDPYFYDLEDRKRGSKVTLHEELEIEDAEGNTLGTRDGRGSVVPASGTRPSMPPPLVMSAEVRRTWVFVPRSSTS